MKKKVQNELHSRRRVPHLGSLLLTGEYVAQFKFTVLLMPNGPHKITGLPFDPEILETDKKIEDLDIQVRYNVNTTVNNL